MVYNIGGKYKVIAVDLGIKYNQIRCLVECNCEVKVVPWNYDFLPLLTSKGNTVDINCSFHETSIVPIMTDFNKMCQII